MLRLEKDVTVSLDRKSVRVSGDSRKTARFEGTEGSCGEREREKKNGD